MRRVKVTLRSNVRTLKTMYDNNSIEVDGYRVKTDTLVDVLSYFNFGVKKAKVHEYLVEPRLNILNELSDSLQAQLSSSSSTK